jgi:hypothetical protein
MTKPVHGRNYEVALSSAEAFHAAGARLLGRFEERFHEGSSRKPPEGIGQVVCCATNLCLGIELYLKAAIVRSGRIPPETHDLARLYSALPDIDQLRLSIVYEGLLNGADPGTFASITIARGPAPEPAWTDYRSVPKDLRSVLRRAGDSFVTWRYLFEHRAPPTEYESIEFEYLVLNLGCEALAQFLAGLAPSSE